MTRKAILAVMATLVAAPALHAQIFTFGGYVKLDVLASKYYDGAPPPDSPLRDFHFPAAIPAGLAPQLEAGAGSSEGGSLSVTSCRRDSGSAMSWGLHPPPRAL